MLALTARKPPHLLLLSVGDVVKSGNWGQEGDLVGARAQASTGSARVCVAFLKEV